MNKITIKQLSDRTGISVATLRRWITEGRIKGAEQTQFKIGSGYIWLVPDDAEIPVPDEVGKRSPNYELSPKKEGISDIAY